MYSYISNYYAIQFGNYLLFQDLDETAYGIYTVNNLDITSATFNANEYLDFWCVKCPTGADCSVPGTEQTNVVAQEGYFMGLDGTGTVFIGCFNDACNGNGTCAEFYTVI